MHKHLQIYWHVVKKALIYSCRKKLQAENKSQMKDRIPKLSIFLKEWLVKANLCKNGEKNRRPQISVPKLSAELQ